MQSKIKKKQTQKKSCTVNLYITPVDLCKWKGQLYKVWLTMQLSVCVATTSYTVLTLNAETSAGEHYSHISSISNHIISADSLFSRLNGSQWLHLPLIQRNVKHEISEEYWPQLILKCQFVSFLEK